jgi:hypothetical protein
MLPFSLLLYLLVIWENNATAITLNRFSLLRKVELRVKDDAMSSFSFSVKKKKQLSLKLWGKTK